MPQLNLHVPQPLARVLRERARRAGVSLSKYVATLLTRDASDPWPRGYLEKILGSWRGDLVRPAQGKLELRDEFRFLC